MKGFINEVSTELHMMRFFLLGKLSHCGAEKPASCKRPCQFPGTCDPVQVIAAGWESVLIMALRGTQSLKTVGTKEIFPKQMSE